MIGIATENHFKTERAFKFQVEANRFQHCGHQSLIFDCECCRTRYQTSIKCKSRICDDCGNAVYATYQKSLAEIVKLMVACKRKNYYASLLTLTVNKARFGDRMPDRDDIRRVYRESALFFKLFAGKWRCHLSKSFKPVEPKRKPGNLKPGEDARYFLGAGSISVMEVGEDNNNLHLHALVFMPFTPLSQLRQTWFKITGDSHVVRIDPIYDVKGAVDYVLKYITKPPQTNSYYRLAEYAWMIKGTRRLRTTGCFYNHLVLPVRKRLQVSCAACCGNLRLYGVLLTQELTGIVLNLYKSLRLVKSGEFQVTATGLEKLTQAQPV